MSGKKTSHDADSMHCCSHLDCLEYCPRLVSDVDYHDVL
jgi:hypothetical protein